MTEVKEIIIEWLKDHNCDGLCNVEAECGCDIDDLAPCGANMLECVVAKAIKCKECSLFDDCDRDPKDEKDGHCMFSHNPSPAPSDALVEAEICPDCGGDGKETCHNPDHGFISAVGGEINRLGCPVCGHDPKYKVINGGICETCNGSGFIKPSTPLVEEAFCRWQTPIFKKCFCQDSETACNDAILYKGKCIFWNNKQALSGKEEG